MSPKSTSGHLKLQPRLNDFTTHYNSSRLVRFLTYLIRDVDAAAHIVWTYF